MKYTSGKTFSGNTDNISLTGYRIVSMFKMLLQSPCGEEAINKNFINDPYVNRNLSEDTICIYINTLRSIGCNISRPSKTNGYKYVLNSHPFKLPLDDDEIGALEEIRRNISSYNDWKLIINIDMLFKTIFEKFDLSDKKTKKLLNGYRSFNIDSEEQLNFINLLEKYCSEKRTVTLKYESPSSGESTIEVILDNLSFENGNLYLWCYNLKLEEIQYLRVDRIKEINTVSIKKSKYEAKVIKAKYKITGMSASIFMPEEHEKIIFKNDSEIIVENEAPNKFRLVQKILSFGNECTVLEPTELKDEVIFKLKSIVNVYDESFE